MQLAVSAVVLLLVVYIYIYKKQPFSDFGNNLANNIITIISASASALAAGLIWMKYDPADIPRRVWSSFTIALCLWLIGEIVWAYQNMTIGEVPIGWQDFFWIVAYVFLGDALIRQYRLLSKPSIRQLIYWVARAVLIVILLMALGYLILREVGQTTPEFERIIQVFYPAAELTLAMVALWLARRFAGGAFARPWIGLLIFAIADFLNAWLELSGSYAWSLENGNPLSMISDTIYISAYLVMALGAFSQWLFLKYGLLSPTETR